MNTPAIRGGQQECRKDMMIPSRGVFAFPDARAFEFANVADGPPPRRGLSTCWTTKPRSRTGRTISTNLRGWPVVVSILHEGVSDNIQWAQAWPQASIVFAASACRRQVWDGVLRNQQDRHIAANSSSRASCGGVRDVHTLPLCTTASASDTVAPWLTR